LWPEELNSECEGGLSVNLTHLKMSWGKGRMMRDCELPQGCLGTIEHHNRIYTGCTYLQYFKAGHPPKFHDVTDVPNETDVIIQTNLEQVQKLENLSCS
jgi:hypothetical protein